MDPSFDDRGSGVGGRGPRGFCVALAIAAALTAAGSAVAKDPEARAQAIAAQLRCPVCQNESVADSPSELAAQMRVLIREKIAAGETDRQILDYFVSRYGQWILLNPPRHGLNWIVWLAPAVVLLGGSYIALSYFRGRVSMSSIIAPTASGGKKQ